MWDLGESSYGTTGTWTFMWNLETLRVEPLCATLRNLVPGFQLLPQTTPKLYWNNPKLFKLLGKKREILRVQVVFHLKRQGTRAAANSRRSTCPWLLCELCEATQVDGLPPVQWRARSLRISTHIALAIWGNKLLVNGYKPRTILQKLLNRTRTFSGILLNPSQPNISLLPRKQCLVGTTILATKPLFLNHALLSVRTNIPIYIWCIYIYIYICKYSI